MAPEEATLVHYLEKDPHSNNVRAYKSQKGRSKRAELHFKTIKQSAHYSVVEVDLKTGRPHQVRVQLEKIGHPIWGDYRYAEQESGPGKQLALRAVRLEFKHPTKGEMISLVAPKPKKQPWDIFDY
jgi:23S rRNA pseudouridine1911/1915/1917 synthase